MPVQMHDRRGSNHKRIYGNTGSLAARRCSTFACIADVKVRNGF